MLFVFAFILSAKQSGKFFSLSADSHKKGMGNFLSSGRCIVKNEFLSDYFITKSSDKIVIHLKNGDL